MKARLLFFVLLTIIVSGFSYGQSIRFALDFSTQDFQLGEIDSYTVINPLEPTCFFREMPGYPSMPMRVITLAIPADLEFEGCSIDAGATVVAENIRVYPTQYPVPTDGTRAQWVGPDPAVYDRNDRYPRDLCTYTGTHDQRQYRYITLEVSPFSYYPKEGKLEILNQAVLEVRLKPGKRNTNPPDDGVVYSLLSRLVDNPEALTPPDTKSPVNPNDVQYLIITDNILVDAFQPLADWKTQKGIPAEILTTQTIFSSWVGATDQLKLKACLQDYYQNKGLKWVLLGGDDTHVPDQDCYGWVNTATPTEDNTIPADLFYGCFDNQFDWNADGDNRIGEPEDNIDMAPELFIGRAPVQTDSQATAFVNKTLQYEKVPPQNSFATEFVSSGIQLWNTWDDHSDADWRSEAMWSEVIAPAWSGTKYRYYDTGTDFPGGNLFDVTASNTVNVLNNGYNYFWMATHGGQQVWAMESGDGFSTFDAGGLMNQGRQGLVITMACNTNAFETSLYGNDPCLSEAFLRNGNGGAVMYHGSSRYGWGNGSPEIQHGSSLEYARDFFFALFNGNPSAYPQSFGAVSAESKTDNIGNASSLNSFRWLMFSINAMGDPELPLLTANPTPLAVNHPVSLYYGIAQDVAIETGVANARVCLSDDNPSNPLYVYAIADNTGSCAVNVTPAAGYDVTLTVTAPNHYPTMVSIPVVPSNEPYLVLESITPNTSSGDATLEAGESVTMDVQLRNLGGVAANNIMLQLEATDPEGFLSLTDITESYSGSLASGETLILSSAFALDIAMNVTNNYPIILSTGISFTAKQTNWFQTSFYVYSDIFPKYLTAVSGIQQVDLQWYAPFGGWKSYYSGGGWLSCSVEEKAMKFSAADFDLDYPLEIAQLASQFYENTPWNGNNAFRFSIYDATTEALLYRTDWISANPSGYTMHFMDYPITLSGDFYLSVESADSVDGFPTNVVSEPMAPENTHSYSGSPGNWTKAGVEYSHYIYVTDAVNGGDQKLSYAPDVSFQQTQGATDLLSGKGPDYTFLGYNIYRDTQKINSAPLNDNEFSDVSLAAGLYAYDVTAVYSEGESCLSNMVFGAALDASTVFYDHFEGTNNWNGDMGCNWSVIYGTGYSGQRSLTDSPEGNYENMTDCRTWTSPPVNIMNANANQASVSFFAKFALEADYDTCYFMVSTELNTGNEEVLGFFTGINTDWTEYLYDISSYMGNGAVYFIFRMKTDPLVNEDGIYIDDFRVRVFENGNAPANNIMAYRYGPEVHLTWAPPMAGGEGWFSHFRWNTHYTTAGDEKATYINLAEFGNAYPMKLEKIRHNFYDRYQNLWEGNTRYTFRVYKKNGVDLIFESEQLEAIAWENEYTLPTPLILDDDVLVSVKPVAATGGPWSLFQNDPTNLSRGFEGNSSVGWYQRNGNWSTSVYLTYTSQKSIDPVWGNPGVALENLAESPIESGAMIPVPAEDLANAPVFKGNTALAKNVLGYNIYRDGLLQNTSPVTTTWYQQSLPYQGYYTYEVKAVYPDGLSVSTLPLPLVYDEVVVMDPPIAAAIDEVTLWFAPEFSCQAGLGNSLEGYPEVRMHSGMGINGTTWNNVIPWEQNGVNGQSSQLFAAGNGLYSITYTPSEYYGTGSDVPSQDQLCMVFNGGEMAELDFGSPWAKEGKATDDYGNCVDIFIPLEFRDTLFFDDFESGLSHWDVTGNWNLTSAEFFSPNHCLTDSPETLYSVPSESSATMNTGVDLSQKANALVEFSLIHFLCPDDLVFVEVSNDDFATIMMLDSIKGSDWKPWKKIQYSLNSMLGATNLKVRFRLVTSNLPEDGVYIDNFVIKASEGSFMVAEIIPHSGNGAFAFFANQTASLDVIVFNGGGMPLSNVPVTLTKTDPGNYVSITDDNGIIESLGIGEVDTLFNVFSLEVSVGAEDMYPLSLSVGADLPAKAMEWFDFGFYVFSDLYPLNLQAVNSEDEVHLSWEAPFSGWYSYQNGGIWDVDWSAAERATLFQAADFSLTYPVYFTTIAHWFSELPDYPWNGNNTFRYNVYDYNSDTLIIQSDWLVATENNYAFLFLHDAVKVDDDFYVSVEVQNMTGPAFPSSAHNEGTTYPQSHSRLGSPGAWTVFDNEWITYLFISGDGGVSGTGDDLTIGYEAGNPVRRQPPGLSQDEVRSGEAKSSVIGYNVYRNGTKINTNLVNGYAFSDTGQPYGTYAYATTAVYAEGESCASNVVSGTFLDPDLVYYEDFEENNEEDWNCGWDFTTADAHSGAVSLANAPWGNYADNQDCWVKADPPISLLNVNAESATLSFWAKYELEENIDTCYVELSTDFWSGQRDTIGYFTGFNTTWQEYTFDVSGYIGKSFVWILHMKTNESVNYDGFYIDDVSLRLYGNDYAPARNFEAFPYSEEVHLDWDWPMAGGEGWFSNWRWTNTTYFNPLEKASYIDIAEFGNAYPMQLTKIRHHFMDWEGNNWNGENEFKFRVYEKDGQTLIFESEVLIASDGVYEYVLPQPLELTDDILLTVKPMDVYPTSCYMSDTDNPGHGYLGSADNGWESINGNWATEVYLANSGSKDNISGTWLAAGIELGNTVPSTNPVGKQILPADVRATLPLFKGNQKLAKSTQGFNVFRDGQQINSVLITNNYFYDTVPHQGVYDYTVKAVYAGGMSVGTVNKSMTIDDVVIMFPMDAAAEDEVTLWFDPFYSCESGQSNSLEGSSEVRMHSAIGVNGSGWVNPIEWDDTGYDGTTTYLNAQPQGQYTITYTPSAFYGVNPASDQIYQLEMVFNSGNSTASPWDKEGKAPDGFGGCENIIIPLNFRSVIFEDDFESGTGNWTLSGSWALTDLEFFTATHALTDSPNSWYSGTSETSATLTAGVDLSGYSSPVLEFNLIHGLGNGDQLFVEISTDDFASATLMATYNFWDWKPWTHETIDLSLFEDETNVKVRFRLATDDTDDGDGVFIDDFAIKGFQATTVVESIPYTQDFTVFPTPDWEQFEGQLTASSVLVPYTGTGTWDGWHEDGFNCSGGSTGAIRGNLYNASHYYWYITPYIDLGSSPQNIELRFDMAGSNWNSCIQALLQSEDHFAVVISTDGTTWTETNTLIEWESGDAFPVYGETFEVDLTGYSGLVKVGFYHGHNSSSTDIEVFIDNVYVGVDDDPLTIAEARLYPIGTQVTVTGVVTNGQELGNIRYFQDATAGIAAYGGSQNGVIFGGDSVTYSGILKDYNGLLEIDPITNMTVIASGVTLPDTANIEPVEVGELYESQLIVIDTAFFVNPSGTFSAGVYSVIGPDADTANCYVRYSTTLIGTDIPSSPVILKGILSQYSPTDPAAGYQIILRDTDDLTPLPLPPTSVQAIATLNDVSLSWDVPLTGVIIPGIDGYNIYRAVGHTALFSSATMVNPSLITGQSYLDQDLANNDYSYWIEAVYGDGEIAVSGRITVTVNNYVNVSGYVTLSDLTPVEGVLIHLIRPNGSSGTHTNASGYYSFSNVIPGLDYTVYCEMTGYTFDPDQRAYTSLSVHITDADFTAIPTTISITGNISDYSGGVADVLITFSNEAGNAMTNSMGDYYHEVPYNYTGLAMPSKDNFLFTPANRSYDDLITDRTGEDYAATCTLTYLVSGTITDGTLPLEGVLVMLTGSKETTLTGSDGTYSFTVNHGYSGTITPTFANYSFTPAAITLTEVTIDKPGNNFIGTPDAYPVSGTVTWNGQPLEGVLLNFESISNDPTTASDGTYTCYVPAGWAGYIAPIKTGFTFTPSFITVPSVSAPVTGQDFSATHNPVAISGTISEGGTPLINVAVVATDDQGAIVDTWYTMSDGGFYGGVPYGFSGDITPEKANYSFTPAFRTYANLTVSVADQDFEGLNVATYSVSGTITDGTSPMEGVTVTLTGSKETTLTGVDGTYSFNVDHGFTGTLTASFTGYSFAPSSISLTNITANSTGNNFVGNIQSCTVSGYVTLGDLTPVEGVLVHLIRPNGSSGTHTNASGYYSFANVAAGADYTVYCEMTGYTFNPEERFYPALAVNITDADFTAIPTTVTISGNIADDLGSVSDVLISFTNGGGTTTTDADGNYSHEVPYNYSGLATPTKSDYTFNPANRTYYDLITDATGEDYAATCTLTYTVSGTITDGASPLEGVTVTLSGSRETTLTGSDGTYSFTVAHGYSGNLSASLAGYAFTPSSIPLSNVIANSSGNDFVGSTDTYTVSGTVTDGVFAMEGVTITLSGSKETTLTASNGSYSFTVAHGFSGTLTPSYSGYVFTPESIDVVNVTANSTSNNFVGSIGEYSVSGTVTLDGLPLEGVLVDFETITSDPVTASDGTYTCMVPTGWYGDITPALAGYIFTPEYLHLSAVSSNISGKDFAAAEVSFTISGTVAEGGVPIEGVDVTFENTTKDILQVVTTASDGTYSCDVPYNWSGTATPSKTDYTFDPESKSYTNVLADVSDEDYEGYSGGLPPGWGYVNTGSNHTLFVQATAPKIDGVPLSYGSWIGVFYDDNGVEKCAGAIEWQGASSPIIAAQGDDSTTPEKDGFSEGETITFKFYINDLKGTALYAAPTYASGPQVYTTNGATVTSLLAAYTSITQVVPLIEGWSGISSYILPDNDSTAIIFAPVVSDLVILKSMTLAFWPPNINQIVHWNTYEGYKLKMINNQQVLFTGQDSEKTFTIPEGWSLLPVLSNQNVDVSSIFSSVLNDIIIIKSIDGMGVYWPSVGVQTLTSLTPGESYMAKFSAQSTITFPPLASKAGSVVKGYSDPVNSDIWSMPLNTGITHTLAFSEQASEIFETGDLLGVFDVNDRCVGIAEVSEGHTPVVSVYGDDQTTIEKDGMFHNEAFVLKVYHVETETIDEILVEYDKQYNIAYCDNGMSVIVKTTSTTGIGSMNLEYTRVFPNPATDKLYIHVPGGDNVDFNVRILSANGGSVLAEKTFSGRTTLNIQPLPAGVYMIEITDGISAPVVKRIIKN